jgi:SAM-dependent methyltransferase
MSLSGTMPKAIADSSYLTYEAMAPVYDRFTAHHDYDGWLTDLLALLERYGLSGKCLLDVGCGTGKSFLPLLAREWKVTGCDISPSMLAIARQKVADSVELAVADMRSLPTFGLYGLVWALDDAINYLLSVEELDDALDGMRKNLAESGLLLFDVNELLVYRTVFASAETIEQEDLRFLYRGKASPDVEAGSICESCLSIEHKEDDIAVPVCTHRQRHFSEAEVLASLKRVGLTCLGVYGQDFSGVPTQPLDVSTHTKAIYIASRAKR